MSGSGAEASAKIIWGGVPGQGGEGISVRGLCCVLAGRFLEAKEGTDGSSLWRSRSNHEFLTSIPQTYAIT